MWIRIRQKKRKPKKDDYRPGRNFKEYPDTKRGRKFLQLLRPDLVTVAERYVWVFELIAPYKNDKGQPRQRTKYLGSLREKYVDLSADYPYRERRKLWRKVERKFVELKLDDKTCKKLRKEISERLPPPTAHELEQEQRRIQKFIESEEAAGINLRGYPLPNR